jgi:hypothetical protein
VKPLSGRTIIIIGAVLVILGFIIPLLMVIHVLESGIVIDFLSFIASTAGVFLGLVGSAMYVEDRRRRQ